MFNVSSHSRYKKGNVRVIKHFLNMQKYKTVKKCVLKAK